MRAPRTVGGVMLSRKAGGAVYVISPCIISATIGALLIVLGPQETF